MDLLLHARAWSNDVNVVCKGRERPYVRRWARAASNDVFSACKARKP